MTSRLPICGFLMVTHAKDAGWAEYSLRSIRKFATGFHSVTVVVPYDQRQAFESMCAANGAILRHYYEAAGKGFLHHQVCKLEADLWCPPEVEVVLHIDADCIYGSAVTPATYFHEGRPILLRERYEDFRRLHPNRYCWKRASDHALGFNCEWETMCRHPGVFERSLYPRLRAHIERIHGMPFTQYALLQEHTYPQGFAEFPTLGAFAIERDSSHYAMVDIVKIPSNAWSDPKWRQFGIVPIELPAVIAEEEREQLKAIVSHALWHNRDGSIVDRPVPDPLLSFWSHHGVARFRTELEQIVA